MINASQTSWVILAGGRASRMGGNDKGLIHLNNKPLISHVIERLQPQTSNIYINANRNQEIYKQFAPIFSDDFSDFIGPMGGIHAALSKVHTPWVGFVPCDSPIINTDLVERFCMQADDSLDILIAHDNEHQQPVFSLYHTRVLEKLTNFILRGERKIILFYPECNIKYVDFSDSPSCFFNLNTPDELAKFGELTN